MRHGPVRIVRNMPVGGGGRPGSRSRQQQQPGNRPRVKSSFKSSLQRPAAPPATPATPRLPRSRVDIEISIKGDEPDDGDAWRPSTSGRGEEEPDRALPPSHPSLSLAASLDPDAVEECALLVILYNIERQNSRRIASRVLRLFDEHPDLAARCETRLPGLTLRLRRNPEGARDALRSLEVLLDIIRVGNPSEEPTIRQEIDAVVGLYAANVGSRDTELLRGLPETPMWQSLMFRATNALMFHNRDDGNSSDESYGSYVSFGSYESDGSDVDGEDNAVLRLRCNSKTAGLGLPMTVSARVEVEKTPEVQAILRERLADGYTGKSLGDIATSVWSALRLSRRDDESSTPTSGELRLDNDTTIDILGMDDLDAVVMALAYLTGDGSDGQRDRNDPSRAVRDAWVPGDARIRFARSRGTPGESTYSVMVTGGDGDGNGNGNGDGRGDLSKATIDARTVDGIIDVLDALRAVDARLFSLVV